MTDSHHEHDPAERQSEPYGDEDLFPAQVFDQLELTPREQRPPSVETTRGLAELMAWMAEPTSAEDGTAVDQTHVPPRQRSSRPKTAGPTKGKNPTLPSWPAWRALARYRAQVARCLRVLTGIDEDVLAYVPVERSRYTAFGIIKLGYACLAGLSMYVALAEVTEATQVWYIPLSALWSLFVLSLDRWLGWPRLFTQSDWRSRAAFLASLTARAVTALLMALLIAVPLLLLAYQPALDSQVRLTRAQAIYVHDAAIARCNPGPESPLPPGCTSLNFGINDAQLVADQQYLADLQLQAQTVAAHADSSQQFISLQNAMSQVQQQITDDVLKINSTTDAKVASALSGLPQPGAKIGLLDRWSAFAQLSRTSLALRVSQYLLITLCFLSSMASQLPRFFGSPAAYERLARRRTAAAERAFSRALAAHETVRALEHRIGDGTPTANLETDSDRLPPGTGHRLVRHPATDPTGQKSRRPH